MDKRKKRTDKPDRVVIQVEESEEITFEQFERTMLKIVHSDGLKEKTSKDNRKSQQGL